MAVTDDDDQGGGGLSYDDDSEEVTGGEGGYLEKVTEGDMGGGGFSGPPKKGDVIYEWPLMTGLFPSSSPSSPVSYLVSEEPITEPQFRDVITAVLPVARSSYSTIH